MSSRLLRMVIALATVSLSCSPGQDPEPPPTQERVLEVAEEVFGDDLRRLTEKTWPGTEVQMLLQYWYARQQTRRLVIGEWQIRVQLATERLQESDVVVGRGHASHGFAVYGPGGTKVTTVRDPLVLVARRTGATQ